MILVTGADGIVGRTVCDFLEKVNERFIPVVHRKKTISRPNSIIADLTSEQELDKIPERNITSIVHLAAAVPHSVFYPDTENTADLTSKIDTNILSIKRKLGIPLVYMSTCGLYDRTVASVKREDDDSLIKIESPYFSAKWKTEKIFENEDNCSILRLAAPVGPGLKPNLVLPRFINAARNNEKIILWGTGSRQQNFIDTRDVAKLILKVLKKPERTIVNVASSKPVTMKELAESVINVAGQGSMEFSTQNDPREGEYAWYSIEKAQQLFDWTPEITLEESCELLLKENFDLNV